MMPNACVNVLSPTTTARNVVCSRAACVCLSVCLSVCVFHEIMSKLTLIEKHAQNVQCTKSPRTLPQARKGGRTGTTTFRCMRNGCVSVTCLTIHRCNIPAVPVSLRPPKFSTAASARCRSGPMRPSGMRSGSDSRTRRKGNCAPTKISKRLKRSSNSFARSRWRCCLFVFVSLCLLVHVSTRTGC